MREYYTQLARADAVAFRLRVANREFCENVGAQVGMFVATVQSLPRKYHSYANEALSLSWTHPTVISVVEGSPAAYAGIKVGDRVSRPRPRAGHEHGWFRHGISPLPRGAGRPRRAAARW